MNFISNLSNSTSSYFQSNCLEAVQVLGANVEEASAGQSRKDFHAKMSIASKEARETKYWLRLLNESQLVAITLDNEMKAVDELIRILTSIVKTTGESK